MAVDYDPFSDEAMTDPTRLYALMREEGAPHYIEKYRAWALARFDDVWTASLRHEKALDYTKGQTPGQVLLGEPIPPTFMTMNQPEHRRWRGLIAPDYSAEGVAAQEERLRSLVRETLAPLLARGEMDVYGDFANRVMCVNAGHHLGLPREDALRVRALIDDMLHREKGQVGATSPRNQRAAGELHEHLASFVARLRRDPGLALRHTRLLMEAEIEGRRLGDEELVANLYSLLVTGSETTPMVTAGTFFYLAKHPEQKAAVLADPKLARKAFLETARFDQPTNMLARRVRQGFELGGKKIEPGDSLLFLYASANRDATKFDRPDEYDIHREPRRDLSFGIGGHVCLGMHLAIAAGVIMIEELLDGIDDWELREDACERAYGEHLSGFIRVPIRFRARRTGRAAS